MSGRDAKISLNCSLTVPTTSLQDGGHTPNTPEILNSIVNMTSGPFSNFAEQASPRFPAPAPLPPTPSLPVASPICPAPSPAYSDTSSSSGASLASPVSPPLASPSSGLSVQHYRSQFIKEGLKMKVQQKLKVDLDVDYTTNIDNILVPKIKVEDEESLTLEDEDRRQRRRERNKVAATKCRNKKKERTGLLMKDAEVLESQNSSLKIEISRLEAEKRHLMDILALHEPSCAKRRRTDSGSAPGAGSGLLNHGASLPSNGSNLQPQVSAPPMDPTFRVPAPPQLYPRKIPASSAGSRLNHPQDASFIFTSSPAWGDKADQPNIADVADTLASIVAEGQVDIEETFGHLESLGLPASSSSFSHAHAMTEDNTEKEMYKSCSVRNAQTNQYFLGKSSSLSQHRLLAHLDNRCLAL